MILPEQTAIQCFPRPQAGFGLRWGRGFCRFLRVVRRFAVTIFCGRSTGGGLTGGVQHRCFFRCGLLGRLGGSCLLRDSSCRGLQFSRRGGLRRGLCRDGIIRFRLPGRLRGWLSTCLRPVQCKGSGKHHGSHHNGQDYFFFIAVFLFIFRGVAASACHAVTLCGGGQVIQRAEQVQ